MAKYRFAVAYSSDNQMLVSQVENRLKRAEIDFEHITCSANGLDFAEKFAASSSPVLLFISDNFLKSEYCMYNALKALLNLVKSDKVQPIIINGRTSIKDDQIKISPTSFEKVSNVMKYMNYWQEQYLELRKIKRTITPDQEEVFDKRLKIVRSVSTEIGEFLRNLRTIDYWTFEQFVQNDFQILFNKVGDQESYEKYKRIANGELPLNQDQIQSVQENTITKSEAEKSSKSSILDKVIKHKNETQVIEKEVAAPIAPNFSIDQIVEEVAAEDKEMASNENGFVVKDKSESYQILDSIFNDDEEDVELEEVPKSEAPAPSVTVIEQEPIPKANPKKSRLEILEELIQIDPSNVHAYLELAEIAESKDDFLLAKNYYEKILTIDSTTKGVFYRLANIVSNYFEDQNEVAAKYYRIAIEENPLNADANYQYALLLSEYFNKYGKAKKYFKRTIDISPDHPFANYDLALLHHKNSDFEKARKFYKKAYKINSEFKTDENDIAFLVKAPEDKDIMSDIQIEDVNEEDVIEITLDNTPKNASPVMIEEEVPIFDEDIQVAEAPVVTQKIITKTVLITGATSGIGKATAEVFAEKGYNLILTGRRQNRLDLLKEHFKSEYDNEILTLAFDVRNIEEIKQTIASIPEEFKDVDILINNAGLASGYAPIHEGDIEDWELMIDTNIKGLLYMSRIVAPGMVARKSGHIINVCSIAGHEVYPNGNVYCATKFAVDALTKSMRIDLHKDNIRVSQVSPGHVEETEFAKVRFHGDSEKAKIYEDFQPLKSSDVANVIYFIASQPAYVNLQDVVMMGTQQASANHIHRSGR